MNLSLSRTFLCRGVALIGISLFLLSPFSIHAESSFFDYSNYRAKVFLSNKIEEKKEWPRSSSVGKPLLAWHRIQWKNGDKWTSSALSTTDCTASFGIDKESLKDYFGVEILEQCSNVSVDVQIESCLPAMVSGFVVGDTLWRAASYPTMQVKSRLMVSGVPVGKHRLLITAADVCGNISVDTLHFLITDKVAPVMKCNNKLTVSLSNSQSNAFGLGYPLAGYALSGYARVKADEIDAGSSDNCGMDWVRVRRAYNPADEASYVALGYDWNADGKITLDGADGVDWNYDGDIQDPMEKFERSATSPTTWMTPALDYTEFFCSDVATGVMIELWGKDRTESLEGGIFPASSGGVPYPTTSGGNMSYCWMTIQIENKVAPTFEVPERASIFCTDFELFDSIYVARTVDLYSSSYQFIEREIFGDQALGRFAILSGDDCGDVQVSVEIKPDLTPTCRDGVVQLIYTARKTIHGKVQTYPAGIAEIEVLNANGFNIEWPFDIYADCAADLDTANVIGEGPNYGCDSWGVHVEDKVYAASGTVTHPKSCFRIERTFTVANWCANSEDVYTQFIYVEDITAPEILNVEEELRFATNKHSCTAAVSIPFSALDACSFPQIQRALPTLDGIAINRVRVKQNGIIRELADLGAHIEAEPATDGEEILRSWTFHAPALPEGTYSLLVVVRDDCGNLSKQAEIPFEVRDESGPTPICYHGLLTELNVNPVTLDGNATVWASDLVASPIDDCNGQGPGTGPTQKPLIQSYYVVKDNGDRVWDAADGLDEQGLPLQKRTFITLSCADAAFSQVLVRLYAADEKGNMGYCETYVVVSDPSALCRSGGLSSNQISGNIATESGNMLEQVEVKLSGGTSMTYMTGTSGEFSFKGLRQGMTYAVTPHRDYDYLNGVTTFDLTLLSKHILGVQPLNSPYKLIAADINGSGNISTADMLALRKSILGIAATFPNNTPSWRFIDKKFQFPDPSNPWLTAFPESISCPNLAGAMSVGFIGVKMGDLNGSSSFQALPRSADQVAFQVPARNMVAGETYRLPLHTVLNQTEGFQFTLATPTLEILAIEPGFLSAAHLGVFSNESMVTASWEKPAQFKGAETLQELFTLVVRAKEDVHTADALHLNDRITRREAFTHAGALMEMSLDFVATPGKQPAGAFELYQNVPNPFSSETVIGFHLPEAGEVTLTVQDVAGRTLYTTHGRYVEGYNQIRINGMRRVQASMEQSAGVLYYTLTSGSFTATKSMIYTGH